MKRISTPIAAAFLAASLSFGATGNVAVQLDVQKPQREFELRTAQETTGGWNLYLLNDGVAFTNLTAGAATATVYFATAWTGSAGVVAIQSTNFTIETAGATNGVFSVNPTKTQTATNGSFVAQVIVTSGAGDEWQWGRGTMTIDPSLSTGLALDLSSADYLNRDGSETMLGSLLPGGSNTLDLGSDAAPWAGIYVATGSVHFVGGGNLSAGGTNAADLIWTPADTSKTARVLADQSDTAAAQAAADAAQSRADSAYTLADSGYDWSDVNERRIAVLWQQTQGITWDMPGGFWLDCTSATEFAADVSSNYTVSASGVAWGPVVMTGTPIAQWKMNDNAADAVVVDSVGTNTGTAQANTDTLTTNGIINSALMFNGSSDYVALSHQLNLTGAVARSVSLWINPQTVAGADRSLICWGINETLTAFDLILQQNGDRLYLFNNSADVYANIALVAESWQHCAVTYDGTDIMLYFNGTQIASAAVALNTAYTVPTIGGNGIAGAAFNGSLDDIRIYDVALSSNQVYALYSTPSEDAGGTPSGGNMLIRSTNAAWTTENYTQTQGRVVLFVTDPDQDTGINTDLRARVSWDNGGNWDALPLTLESSWPSGTMIYSCSTNWSGPGTQGVVEVSVDTSTGADGTLEGIGVFSRE